MTDPWEEQERREMQAEREDGLMAENEELRKLAADIWRYHTAPMPYTPAEVAASIEFGSSVLERIRDLGVEVADG